VEPYMKRFVFASLFYLGLAAIFGILNGLTDIGYFGTFAHSHFNLLGFMAMIVFGIGYFILPRFNGTDLRWPGWVPVHFWLANITLVGMVVFRGLQIETGSDLFQVLFIIAAALQVVSLFMFIVNIWVTLSPRKKPSASVTLPTIPKAAPPQLKLSADSAVAELIDRTPSVQTVLVEQGVKMLGVPGHLDKVRKVGVTLGMVAANHGLDLDTVLAAVGAEIKRAGTASPTGPSTPVTFPPEMLIGKVMEDYPQTKVVFERYMGDGCFECPGQAYESIDMACRMHGVDCEQFIDELGAAAAETPLKP